MNLNMSVKYCASATKTVTMLGNFQKASCTARAIDENGTKRSFQTRKCSKCYEIQVSEVTKEGSHKRISDEQNSYDIVRCLYNGRQLNEMLTWNFFKLQYSWLLAAGCLS